MFKALGLGKSWITNGNYLQQIVNFFVVDLQERTVNIEKGRLVILIDSFNFLKQSKDCSGDKSSVVFIKLQIFEESVLLLFAFCIFCDSVLPITAEHRMSLA
jgi:hypothetical protein